MAAAAAGAGGAGGAGAGAGGAAGGAGGMLGMLGGLGGGARNILGSLVGGLTNLAGDTPEEREKNLKAFSKYLVAYGQQEKALGDSTLPQRMFQLVASRRIAPMEMDVPTELERAVALLRALGGLR